MKLLLAFLLACSLARAAVQDDIARAFLAGIASNSTVSMDLIFSGSVQINNPSNIVTGNGGGLTNLPASKIIGAQTSTIFTNWPSGRFITNYTGRDIDVSCSVTNFPAALLGACGMELWIGPTTNSATLNGVSATTLRTVVAGITTVQEFLLSGRVPVGGYWVFTNISSGAGNTVSMRLNSGQYSILP